MRIPLITPLASRNGTVDKDERLVNCYGEQDVVTKETRVIKRAGIDEGDAMLTGPDIYGQGIFNYDGYVFAVMNDVLGYWVYVGGGGPGGGGGGTYISFDTPEWDAGTTHAIGDKVFYNGTIYYNYIPGSGVTPGSNPYTWQTTPPGALRYSATFNGYTGSTSASKDAAGYSAWLQFPYRTCATRNMATGVWEVFAGISGNNVLSDGYLIATGDTCESGPIYGPNQGVAGTTTQV